MKKMSIINLYTFKNIKANKGKIPLIIACVFLTTIMVFLSLAISNVFRNYQILLSRKYFGNSDISITALNSDQSKFGDITRLLENEKVMSKCEYVSSTFVINFTSNFKDDNDYLELFLLSADFEDVKKINPVKFVSKPVNELGDYEIIVSKMLAKRYNIKVNDTIQLKQNPLMLTVVGISDTSGFWSMDPLRIAMVNKKTMSSLTLVLPDNLFNSAFLKLKDYNDLEEVTAELKEIYPFFAVQEVVNEMKNSRAVEQALIPFSISAFVVCCFCFLILVLIMNLIFSDRIKQFATLRSVGATRKQLLGSLIRESSFYGIVGSCSAMLILGLLVLILPNCTSLTYVSGIDWWKYIAALLFGIFVPIFASIYPAIKNLKISIRQTMVIQQVKTSSKIVKVLIYLAFLILSAVVCVLNPVGENTLIGTIGVVVLVISAILIIPHIVNMFAHILMKFKFAGLPRFSSVYIKNSSTEKSVKMVNRILCMGIYTMLLLGFVVGTLGSVASATIDIPHQRYLVNGLKDYTPETLEYISNIEGVTSVVPSVTTNWTSILEHNVLAFTVDGYRIDDIEKIYGDKILNKNVVLNRMNNSDVNYALFNVSYKYLFGVEENDVVTLCPSGLKTNAFKVVVAGFVDTPENYTYTICFNIDTIIRIKKMSQPNVLYLDMDPAKYNQVRNKILEKFPKAMVFSRNAATKQLKKDMNIPITIFKMYIGFVAVLCLVSLTIGIILSLKANIQCHRTMFMLGMSKMRFNLTFILQILFTILVSFVFALMLIALSAFQLQNIVLQLGMYIQTSLKIGVMISIIILFIAVSLMASYFIVNRHQKEYAQKK